MDDSQTSRGGWMADQPNEQQLTLLSNYLRHPPSIALLSSKNRDFLLKPELLRAISDLGFEHPSEGSSLVVFFLHSIPGRPV